MKATPFQVGSRHGKLTLIWVYPKISGKTQRIAHCLCDCGKEYRVAAHGVFSGRTKSCPNCVKRQRISPRLRFLNEKFRSYQGNARVRGHLFGLGREDFDVIFSGGCHYCGISPANGVDRVDNSKGYSPQNCVSCCKTCNLAKREMLPADFLSWIFRVAQHQGFVL